MSYLLPCFAVDHLYLSCDEYLFSEEETAIAEGSYILYSLSNSVIGICLASG